MLLSYWSGPLGMGEMGGDGAEYDPQTPMFDTPSVYIVWHTLSLNLLFGERKAQISFSPYILTYRTINQKKAPQRPMLVVLMLHQQEAVGGEEEKECVSWRGSWRHKVAEVTVPDCSRNRSGWQDEIERRKNTERWKKIKLIACINVNVNGRRREGDWFSVTGGVPGSLGLSQYILRMVQPEQ